MPYTFVPSTAGNTSVIYGVQEQLSGYILQDFNVNEDVNTVQIPDQRGAIAQVFPLQHHWTLSFTAIGSGTAPVTVGSTLKPENQDIVYYVNSCERRATYNDSQKWAVQLEAWDGAVAKATSEATEGTALGPGEQNSNP